MAVDLFLKLDGIEGESKDHAHGGEIDILAYSFGAVQSGTFHLGGGGGGGKVNVNDLTITKYVDLSTPVLMYHCFRGKPIPEAIFTARKSGEAPIDYLVVTMKKVIVSSISTGGNGGDDRFTETVSLNFADIECKYTEETDEGGEGASKTAHWDIVANDGDVS